MKRAIFRFYAELNDLLPPERRGVAFEYAFSGAQIVKHLIESAGVPHTEVDLVLVNGASVGFGHVVEDGDQVSVYPVFEAFDIRTVSQVRPEPLRQTRFVLDAHLGRLAAYLRMLGFDTLYRKDFSDEELAHLAAEEHRILLTRDRGLLKRSAVMHGGCVHQAQPRRQLQEVVARFDLAGSVRPFTRCMRCNELLRGISREQAAGRVPPKSFAHSTEFRLCPGCGQSYWNGSHYRRMQTFIAELLGSSPLSEISYET
jgi:uncharacterized protein